MKIIRKIWTKIRQNKVRQTQFELMQKTCENTVCQNTQYSSAAHNKILADLPYWGPSQAHLKLQKRVLLTLPALKKMNDYSLNFILRNFIGLDF